MVAGIDSDADAGITVFIQQKGSESIEELLG